MGAIMPGPGMRATEDISAESDLAVGDKIRGLMTLKGSQIVTPYIRQNAATDAAGNSNLLVVVGESDLEMFYTEACYLFGFNGTTWDRLRGDINGLQVMGTVAHDAVDAGNPQAIGGFATLDVSAEADVAVGDRVRGIFTRKGAQIIAASSPAGDSQNANAVRTLTEGDAENLLGILGYGIAPDGLTDRIRTLGDVAQDGLGQLCVATAVPGAGVVSSVLETINNTTTRVTAATPTSGNRIRVISVSLLWTSTTNNDFEVYFGTGASISTDETKAIFSAQLDADVGHNAFASWPDGGGPVGSVDDVLSVRTGSAVVANATFIIQLREE